MNIDKLNTLMKKTAQEIDTLEVLVARQEEQLMTKYELYEHLRRKKNNLKGEKNEV